MAAAGDSRTPRFSEVLDRAIDRRLGACHFCMIAVVESYNPSQGRADVRPVRRYVTDDGDVRKYSVIPDVPVSDNVRGGYVTDPPLSVGDRVVLVFGERSLDEWLAGGGNDDVVPQIEGKCRLTDAIIVGTITHNQESSPIAHATRLIFGENTLAGAKLQVESGQVTLGTPANELLDILQTAFGALATGFTAAQAWATASATYAGAAGTGWTNLGQAAAATAAATWGTASTTAATALGVASTACSTAQTAINVIRGTW